MTSGVEQDFAGVIASAAAGDDVAFAGLVEAYQEDMRRVCVVVCGDAVIADDAVTAAWAIAWRKLGSVREPGRLRSWLVSVAVNEARQLLRARRRRSLLEVPVEISSAPRGADPASGIGSIDLRNALAHLSVDDRTLLALRYVAGFDSTELSRATGLSPSGTRARLARLLSRLERELGDG